jgi:hypothetical protein
MVSPLPGGSNYRSMTLASIAAFLTGSMPFSAWLVGHKTPHSGNGIVRIDSHTHQNLSYLGRGSTSIEIRRYHMNAGKPIFCTYPRRRWLCVASEALNVTIDASVGVSRRRLHQHDRGDEQDGDGHADRRRDRGGTHTHKCPAYRDGV